MRRLLAHALERGVRIYIPAGVVGQAWSGGNRQQPLAALMAEPLVEVVPLDATLAKAAGELCGRSGTSDVIDATVALCGRFTASVVITSDPDDLRLLDPRLNVAVI